MDARRHRAGGVVAISGCLGDGGSGDQQTIQFLTMGVGDNIREFFEEEYDVN